MPPPSYRTWRPLGHLLPTEILSIIFRLVIRNEYDTDRVRLMLVCRYWYAIVLSTPGIPSVLWIRKSTTMEMVRASIRGSKWLLTVIIHMDGESIGQQDFNAGSFFECVTSAIEVTSRCKFLSISSSPPPEECKVFQIVPPLKSLEFSYLSQGCDIVSFFELLMTTIATNATPCLTDMTVLDLNTVLYLAQPDCLHVFCSLTTLSIGLSKRMESPGNILPHLQRLENFRATHLYLPSYPPDADLPLTQTLLYLKLQSVSVQWMAGKVFPVLQECLITFPHKIDTIYDRPVTMPACTSLTYRSNDLRPLRFFHALPLAKLTARSGQWNVTRGNLQLMTICHIIVPHAQNLTKLELQVRCSGKLLIHMLSLLPDLEVLHLRLANPRVLKEAFFRSFIATKSNADGPYGMRGMPSLPLCLNLVQLIAHYERWLRGPERTALLLAFSDIASSRQSEEGFQLCLAFENHEQSWSVSRHVETINEIADHQELVLGVSCPHGIIPLELIGFHGPDPLMRGVPFREAEYVLKGFRHSIGPLLTLLQLVELRVRVDEDILLSEPPPNLPLFHTLKALEASGIHPSFLAGQTFHKLEKCRMSLYEEGPELSQDQVTQMPVWGPLGPYHIRRLLSLASPDHCLCRDWASHVVCLEKRRGFDGCSKHRL